MFVNELWSKSYHQKLMEKTELAHMDSFIQKEQIYKSVDKQQGDLDSFYKKWENSSSKQNSTIFNTQKDLFINNQIKPRKLSFSKFNFCFNNEIQSGRKDRCSIAIKDDVERNAEVKSSKQALKSIIRPFLAEASYRKTSI